ncbi:TRAM, LAG1 and CLN8 (TLC) lipid-sensing domain containing protein [Wolffia australiana]
MARAGQLQQQRRSSALFFGATMVLWSLSVAFEITFNKKTQLLAILGGFCFYRGANFVIRRFISRDPLFVNTSVSLVHSTVTSASVVLILVNQWLYKGLYSMFEHSELFSETWWGAYTALCFSCGYFAYDQWDMLRYRLYSGLIPSILVHHLTLLLCFTLAIYRNVTINYLILSLVCELHSIFLHVRKVRRMAGVKDSNSWMVKIEWVLNWAAFFSSRLLCHILITYKLIKDAPKFGKGIELPLALLGMTGMNILNILLGLDLFRAFRREMNRRKNKD